MLALRFGQASIKLIRLLISALDSALPCSTKSIISLIFVISSSPDRLTQITFFRPLVARDHVPRYSDAAVLPVTVPQVADS